MATPVTGPCMERQASSSSHQSDNQLADRVAERVTACLEASIPMMLEAALMRQRESLATHISTHIVNSMTQPYCGGTPPRQQSASARSSCASVISNRSTLKRGASRQKIGEQEPAKGKVAQVGESARNAMSAVFGIASGRPSGRDSSRSLVSTFSQQSQCHSSASTLYSVAGVAARRTSTASGVLESMDNMFLMGLETLDKVSQFKPTPIDPPGLIHDANSIPSRDSSVLPCHVPSMVTHCEGELLPCVPSGPTGVHQESEMHPRVASEESSPRDQRVTTLGAFQSQGSDVSAHTLGLRMGHDVASLQAFSSEAIVHDLQGDATTLVSSASNESFTSVFRSPHEIGRRYTMALWLLILAGIIPFRGAETDDTNRCCCCRRKTAGARSLYQWFILAFLCAGAGISVQPLFLSQDGQLDHAYECVRLGLVSDLPLSFASVLGLISVFVASNGRSLLDFFHLLHAYGAREVFDSTWVDSVHWNLALTLLIWIAAVAERIRGVGAMQCLIDGKINSLILIHIIMFAVSSFILMALSFCMLYTCLGLVATVNAFCVNFVVGETLQGAVGNWNTVQAILRTGSRSVQRCLFVLQAAILFTSLLATVDMWKSQQQGDGIVSLLIPHVILLLGISMPFFKAAEVTDVCARVPALINSCRFGGDESSINTERHYVVEYVKNSAAGFYVFEIMLTSSMTLNFAYVIVVAIFYLASTIFWGN